MKQKYIEHFFTHQVCPRKRNISQRLTHLYICSFTISHQTVTLSTVQQLSSNQRANRVGPKAFEQRAFQISEELPRESKWQDWVGSGSITYSFRLVISEEMWELGKIKEFALEVVVTILPSDDVHTWL